LQRPYEPRVLGPVSDAELADAQMANTALEVWTASRVQDRSGLRGPSRAWIALLLEHSAWLQSEVSGNHRGVHDLGERLFTWFLEARASVAGPWTMPDSIGRTVNPGSDYLAGRLGQPDFRCGVIPIVGAVAIRHAGRVGRSVLVVDDDAAFQAVAVAVLSAQGLTVAGCAADGREAISAARRLKPQGVLLDMWLRSENGLQVARQLCALDPAPRVLLTSSDSTASTPALARACGAVGFVAKVDLVRADLRAYFESDCRPTECT
jgi:CheY-like chemotaxis protein